jgi:hypothetical protein
MEGGPPVLYSGLCEEQDGNYTDPVRFARNFRLLALPQLRARENQAMKSHVKILACAAVALAAFPAAALALDVSVAATAPVETTVSATVDAPVTVTATVQSAPAPAPAPTTQQVTQQAAPVTEPVKQVTQTAVQTTTSTVQAVRQPVRQVLRTATATVRPRVQASPVVAVVPLPGTDPAPPITDPDDVVPLPNGAADDGAVGVGTDTGASVGTASVAGQGAVSANQGGQSQPTLEAVPAQNQSTGGNLPFTGASLLLLAVLALGALMGGAMTRMISAARAGRVWYVDPAFRLPMPAPLPAGLGASLPAWPAARLAVAGAPRSSSSQHRRR